MEAETSCWGTTERRTCRVRKARCLRETMLLLLLLDVAVVAAAVDDDDIVDEGVQCDCFEKL